MGMALEEIRIRGVAEGFEKVVSDLKATEAAQKATAAAVNPMAAALERMNREMLSASVSLRRVETAINPVTAEVRKHEQALRVLHQARSQQLIDDSRQAALAAQETQRHQIAVRQIEERMALQRRMLTAGANDNSGANRFGLASYQVGNLRSQALDAGTMLASGSSLMQVLSTQGAQVYEAMAGGEKGIKGVAEGLASLVTPTTVAIGGFAALAAGAIYFATRADSSVKSAEDALKDYNTLLGELREGYGAAATAAEQAFAKAKIEGVNVAAALIGESRDVIRASLGAEMDKLIPKTQGFVTSFKDLSPQVLAAQQHIRDIGNDLSGNRITVAQFRDEIAKIRLPPDTPLATKKIVDDLLDASTEARNLTNALNAVGAAAAEAASKSDRIGYAKRLEPLDLRMNPDLTKDLTDGLNQQREEILNPKKSPHEEYEKSRTERMQGYAEELAALQRQNVGLTTTVGEVAELEFTTRKLADARKAAAEAGEKFLPEDEERIRGLGRSIGELTDQMERQRLEQDRMKRIGRMADDISFERSTLFMTEGEASVASALRQAKLTEADPAGAYLASQMRMNDSLKDFRALHHDVWAGVREDIEGGAKAGEVFGNALKRIGDRLMDRVFEQFEQSAFSGLASLFGMGAGSPAAMQGTPCAGPAVNVRLGACA